MNGRATYRKAGGLVGKTILIQSGFSGSFLGRLTVEVANGRVSDFDHELLEVTEATEPDAEVEGVVSAELKIHRERLNQVVGRTESTLHRMTVLEAPMDNLIPDSYMAPTGADAAFSHGLRYGAPVLPGDVTQADLWQMIPTNPEIFTAEMTGEEILFLLEQSFESVYASDPLRQNGGYPIRVSGLSAVVRLNNPGGARIQQLEIGGKPYLRDQVYRVAGAGEQDLSSARNKTNTGTTAIEALEQSFGQNSPVNAENTNVKFIAI